MVESALRLQLDRIRRRKWVVALMVLLFLIGGGASVLTSKTTYSSKAALGATSQTRSPDQDAILAEGYVNFFNDPNYQATLRGRAKVPADVTFEAEAAAASPLIYVTASSLNPDVVRPAAAAMATALLDTVNDALRASRDSTIAAVRKPYDDTRAANGVVPQQALIEMQNQINAINADTTNQLSILQPDSGVSSTSPNVVQAIGLALFAGVVAGCAVTLAMGALTRRVDSEIDLTEKTGLPVLAVVPNGDDAQRTQRYGQLANALARSDPAPAVLAVAPVKEMTATAPAAWAIAAHRADQGLRVLVLDADLRTPGSGPGLAEYLSSPDAVDVKELIEPSAQHVGVLELSRGAQTASIRAVDGERLQRLLSELRHRADLVVVIAPPITETAESQVVCAATDATLLVVERSVTKTADVNEARRLLRQVDARMTGAVLVEKGAESMKPVWWTTPPAESPASPTKVAASAEPARAQPVRVLNGADRHSRTAADDGARSPSKT